VFRSDRPDEAKIYFAGDLAEAEPAVPGWTFLTAEILANG